MVTPPALTLSDRDFEGIPGLPFRVSRNVTITGASADPMKWPRLALGGTDKVQLGNAVWLTITRIIVRPAEWDEAAFRSPRFRLLVPTPPGHKAVLELRDACMNLPYGFDPSLAEPYVLSWARPPEMPGTQLTKYIPTPDRVPPFSAWVSVMYDTDVSADTTISDPVTGSVQSLNYITWIVASWLVFDTRISADCMAANRGDPVPCYLSEVKCINPYGMAPNGTANGTDATAGRGVNSTADPSSAQGQSGGSDGMTTGQIVGIAVGSAVFVVLAVSAAVFGWIAWRRRRGSRGGDSTSGSGSSSGPPEQQEKGMTPGTAGSAAQGAWPRGRTGSGGLCCCLCAGALSADVEAGLHSGAVEVQVGTAAASSMDLGEGELAPGSKGVRVIAPPAGAVGVAGKDADGGTAVAAVAALVCGADGSSRQLSQGVRTGQTSTTVCSSSGAGGDFSQPMQWVGIAKSGGPGSELLGGGGSAVGGSDGGAGGPSLCWTPQPTGGGGSGRAAKAGHVDLLSTGGTVRGDAHPGTVVAAVSAAGDAGGGSTALSGSVGLGGSKGLGLSEEVVGYRTPLRPGLATDVQVDDGLGGALLAADNTGLEQVVSSIAEEGGEGGGVGADGAAAQAAAGVGAGAAGLAAGGASRRRLTPAAGPDVVEVLPVVLGKGSYGRVFEGRYRGMRVAVKQVLAASGPFGMAQAAVAAAEAERGTDQDQEVMDTFAQEVDVLGRCDHPNIARLYAACLTRPKLALVMELADTSLDKLLFREYAGSLMPLGKVLHIATQIALGLSYLHPTIVHRDLKPANVLINNPTSDTPIVKLTDFGLARIYESTMSTASPEAGTAAFLAPECFDLDNNVVTHRADIYSFGVVVWTMLSGQEPWKNTRGIVEIAVKLTMRNERLPLSEALGAERCPPKLERLLASCWDADPKRRPAAADVAKELVLIGEQLSQPERSTTGTSHRTSASSASLTVLPAAAGMVPRPGRPAAGSPAGSSGQ
ncbi:hypothetical protein HXX76_008425 [Chlamydomonas incerta]|uniref:Protein kinase domain-containing protein n=1 Tax=Chlamydomonas incerta TaxID=51695 RepID=A0A835W1A1_CHLIN|nr:hypothetical protein HXX76_008425 [Chlamydomonas incerta]|eukprot:KAG2433364.1 hypothetical protein HXX76_008425 [Chlamydomonas incerta]